MKNLEVVETKEKGLASWSPQNFNEAMKFAEMVAKTNFVPNNYKGKAEDCLMAMMTGNEVGLKPMQSLQNIAVINGQPSIYGDAALALVKAAPDFESIHEEFIKDNQSAKCTIKCKGQKEVVREFSIDDAKRAGLWDKNGPWKTYPKRMLQMRARAWAIRDCFPHVLKGLSVSEEAQDIRLEPKQAEGTHEDVSCENGYVSIKNELLNELKNSLDNAVEKGVTTKDDADTTFSNSEKYRNNETNLRAFVSSVKKKIAEMIEAKEIENDAIEVQGEVE